MSSVPAHGATVERIIPGWVSYPLVETQTLTTSIALDREYWIMLTLTADVYPAAKDLFKKHQVTGNSRTCWALYKSYIHQASHYWEAARKTAPESGGLLYYYCFMNLVKAFLLLKNVPLTGENEVHGLSTRKNTWKGSLVGKQVFITPPGKKVSVFSAYYSAVFGWQPPPQISIWKLCSYIRDISHQFAVVARKPGSAFYFSHRFAVDNVKKDCWCVLAIAKAVQMEKRRRIYKEFFREYSKIDTGPHNIDSLRSVFEFKGMEWMGYDFYQTRPGREINISDGTTLPIDQLRARISGPLGNFISPEYRGGGMASGLIYLPPSAKRHVYMNEEFAIYITMFAVSEMLRYHSDYHERILRMNSGWLIRSFIESAPLTFLRIITSRINGIVTKICSVN